jgi:hypothetical protein
MAAAGRFSLLLFLITASTYGSLQPAAVPDHGISGRGDPGHGSGAGLELGARVPGLLRSWGCSPGLSSWLPALLIRRIGVRGTILAGAAVMAGGLLPVAGPRPADLLPRRGPVRDRLPDGRPDPRHPRAVGDLRKRALPFGIYFTFGALGGVAGPWMVVSAHGRDPQRLAALLGAAGGAGAVVGLICAVAVGGRAGWSRPAPPWTSSWTPRRKAGRRSRVYHTDHEWSVRDAVRTPQFYVLLAAYFSHLLAGISAASLTQAHLTQLGVAGSRWRRAC